MKKSSFVLLVILFLGVTNAQVELRYWLWDANQQPGYEACAADFHEQNPDISIKVEQLGWSDYWTGLQTEMVAGGAPDVFTDYVVFAKEFAEKGQIVDIAPLVEEAGIDTEAYIGESASLWEIDGGRYGLPKDWDGIAVVYNKAMFEAADVNPAVAQDWTFNLEDGGSFAETVARLTLDADGNNGLSPDFDKSNVVQYGFINGEWSPHGNNTFGTFALSNGWEYGEGDNFNFGDSALADTLDLLVSFMNRGYSPPATDISGLNADAIFQAARGAMTVVGSWQITQMAGSDFEVGFLPVPAGTAGRQIVSNSLGDSIWVGTKHPDEAWLWVSYLASEACQDTVGSYAAVLPALPAGTEAALNTFAERGIDISAFTEVVEGQDDSLNYFPVTSKASEMNAIMQPALDTVFLGRGDAEEVLKQANDEVNSLF